MIATEKHGPWALIAGGSEGVGGAFAHALGAAGLNLVLVAHEPDPLEATAREIRSRCGVQVRTVLADLRGVDSVEPICAAAEDLEVGLLVFVAATSGQIRPFVERTLEDVLAPVQLCVVVQTMLTHHFARRMAARGRGGIILISSFAGNAGTPNLSTYGGAKAYQQLLAEALWAELRPLGVDVLAFVLGPTDTPAKGVSGLADAAPMPVLTAAEVAKHALDALGAGPVATPPPLEAAFREAYALPRGPVVERKAKLMAAALSAGKP